MTTRYHVVAFVLSTSALVLAGCSSSSSSPPSGQDSEVVGAPETSAIRLVDPEAGIDFPTDKPMPTSLTGKQILVIENARIIVDGSATLEAPKAGLDYPTDRPPPAALAGKSILVLDEVNRVVIDVQAAVAGVDYPTDTNAKPFSVWAFSETNRVPLDDIASIEKSKAGVDYPTDTPPRDFFVVVTTSGERSPIGNEAP
jgi:hypothetical protein